MTVMPVEPIMLTCCSARSLLDSRVCTRGRKTQSGLTLKALSVNGAAQLVGTHGGRFRSLRCKSRVIHCLRARHRCLPGAASWGMGCFASKPGNCGRWRARFARFAWNISPGTFCLALFCLAPFDWHLLPGTFTKKAKAIQSEDEDFRDHHISRNSNALAIPAWCFTCQARD